MAAGLHIYDPEADDWNVPAVAAACPGEPAALVAWAVRRRGLILRESDRDAIRSLADLPGRRVVPRQEESGAQALFAHLCAKAGIHPTSVRPVAAARSEADAALAVVQGAADAAFGLEALAQQLGLAFVPVTTERFDLLVDRRAWFEPPMQRFFAFCRSDAFRERAAGFRGYDIAGQCTVRWNGP